jgi:hypothetical protein
MIIKITKASGHNDVKFESENIGKEFDVWSVSDLLYAVKSDKVFESIWKDCCEVITE